MHELREATGRPHPQPPLRAGDDVGEADIRAAQRVGEADIRAAQRVGG